ncbi:MarR family transcriptional regulator [Paludibacterium yongneupense]|uniref:MarR family transcriptional regulator n=1 Tax=Paludibacterium yongneupense TaxID=400061 RepID=UPI00040B4F28|nr:MarR family transcriptional regulator [Paludibacterium yongneupense]
MNQTFHSIEQAIADIEKRFPGGPRQEVLLARLLSHVQSRMTCRFNLRFKDVGINETDWIGLLTIYIHPEQALYPSDLSEALGASRTSATRMADLMVERGWVARSPCGEDRRKVKLRLTEEGVRFVGQHLPTSRELFRSLWDGFETDEKDTLEILLRKLLARLGG